MVGEKKPAEGGAHALQDHALGRDLMHAHEPGGEYDHDHDDFDTLGPLEENPIWMQDHVSLTSVGIDIGSSGTQVIFSRVNLRRLGEDLSSHYFVVSRETLFQSPVALTPYESEERIDQRALGGIIDQAYHLAGMGPEQIDTGAVILTGEALRRENAEAIAGIVAERGGDFVCATAGHHMEAMLAAFGSGASRVSADEGRRLLNIDIGGGTTKLAVIERGRVVSTAAFHVGGRLQVVDDAGRITRLDPAGKRLAAMAGFSWSLGDMIDPADLDVLAESMADAVLSAVGAGELPAPIGELYLTGRLADLSGIDGVMFSGGVAEYLYGREARDFGDLGRRLGHALRRKLEAGALPWPLLPAKECIRATALGASEYSVQLTGNTIYISNNAALLPRRNLQVVKPACELPQAIDPAAVAAAIQQHLALFDLSAEEREFALAFQWRGEPSYERVAAFAQGIVDGLPLSVARKQPLYLILDGDLAQTLGGVLREDFHVQSEILVIDGVVLLDFDYIDLGRIRLPSHTVPVTIKSLVFDDVSLQTQKIPPAAPLAHDPHEHTHHHGHSHDHDHDHGDGRPHHHHHDHGPQPGPR
ncbi:ethanolamine ammonia-lyase reactivating factor EutA [Nevskia soli]|uniref:ethanolamine ammonia-lyase reactivating factor EutA n=1 Tax=Nevskia soli TaxID=418856 RepID=UPI0004A730DA|nr:ethanolamine ammonia-lyase reactivating factor EutA [Nevskia soli]